MNLIFLGPAETGSWDAWLFGSQVFLALAAFGSPFIANLFSNGRARRADDAARRRQQQAQRAADNRLAREKSAYSESVFYAVYMEAQMVKEDVDRDKPTWRDSGKLPTSDTPHLKISVPFAMGDSSLWLHLTDPWKLRATINLVNALISYNREIDRLQKCSQAFVSKDVRDLVRKKIDKLDETLDELLEMDAEIPRKPFRSRLFV